MPAIAASASLPIAGGLVTNAEYVNPEGVDVSGSTYTLEPNYGWRRVFAEETPAAKWSEAQKIEPFLFTGYKESPFQMHLKRAIADYFSN